MNVNIILTVLGDLRFFSSVKSSVWRQRMSLAVQIVKLNEANVIVI